MNFTAEYQLTFEEFKEAMLCVKRQCRKRVFPSIPRGVLPTSFIVGGSILLFLVIHHGQTSINSSDIMVVSSIAIIGFAAWAIAWIVYQGLISIQRQRTWDKSPEMHLPVKVSITNQGIDVIERSVEHRAAWAYFIRIFEMPRMFLLFHTKTFALAFPKRIFGDPEAEKQVAELFRREIGNESSVSSVKHANIK